MQRKNLKRHGLIMVVVTLAILLVGASVAVPQEKPYAGTTVRFLRHSGYGANWMRSKLPEFERITGIKVEIEEIAYIEMHRKQMLLFSSEAGIFDMYTIDSQSINQYGKGGWLMPQNDFLANPALNPDYDIAGLIQSLLDLNRYQGNLLAMPFKFNTGLVYYNTEILESGGFDEPTTWDEYLNVVEKSTQKGKGRFGHVSAYLAVPACDSFISYLRCAGGLWLYKEEKNIFNTEEGYQALEFMKELFQYEPPGGFTRMWDDVANIFAQGKTAIARGLIGHAGMMQDPDKSLVVGKVAYGHVPKKIAARQGASTWGIGIDSLSKNPEAAYLFIQWLFSEENMKDFVIQTGGSILPIRSSVLQDPEIVAQFPQFLAAKDGAEGAYTSPAVPAYGAMREIIGKEVQAVLIGQKMVRQALDDAVEKCDQKIQEMKEE